MASAEEQASQQGKSLSFSEVITRYSEVRAGRIVQSMDELNPPYISGI